MFTNNTFNLEYNTLSHEEIKNIEIEKLSNKGTIRFVFLPFRIYIYVDNIKLDEYSL